MARAIWNGTVGFGLVQIPVGLYSAESPNELDLTLLDKGFLADRLRTHQRAGRVGRAAQGEGG
jgi:non-homologous end joining protein Ku